MDHRTLGLARVPRSDNDYADVGGNAGQLASDEPDGHYDLTGQWGSIGAFHFGRMTGEDDQGIKP